MFSSLKGETAQHPARVSVLMIAFGITNPVLILGLMALLMNAQDDAVVQITQATCQALVDKLTAVESSATVHQNNSTFDDGVISSLDSSCKRSEGLVFKTSPGPKRRSFLCRCEVLGCLQQRSQLPTCMVQHLNLLSFLNMERRLCWQNPRAASVHAAFSSIPMLCPRLLALRLLTLISVLASNYPGWSQRVFVLTAGGPFVI